MNNGSKWTTVQLAINGNAGALKTIAQLLPTGAVPDVILPNGVKEIRIVDVALTAKARIAHTDTSFDTIWFPVSASPGFQDDNLAQAGPIYIRADAIGGHTVSIMYRV